ncbi:bacteriophage abortive infection AbiH family protein [Candidatus Symbiopectobacterium sp. NZEC135]|uniref:bacteriophage abortive infection AbiH family protein n=1 Tax=Candidatus Symbiopectobacterium sp. NZEC135 TaxID=2820471 RepID=UPI0022265A0F|nr:bacteriophage abortive infection AbiH family protein [Candidatus Symbiopectobacterium sp. NZEC135]MCW2478041.1 bacteriophage abortive infection AbiH family protein [Candidatus Symbiopectobacterium sp. NZEC135]
MPPTTLYIIGNGFDLWHGIPSTFGHFKDYVQNVDSDVYREVEEYLPAGENWSELEQALSMLDADMLLDNLGHFMTSYNAEDWSDSGHHDFQYEVKNVVDRLSKELQAHFADWVRTLHIPTHDNVPSVLSRMDQQALFLNFNYTSTLIGVYGVSPQCILFIHGCAAQPDEVLILGHAWNPSARRSLNDRHDISGIDTRLMEANDIIDNYFSLTFKHSAELITQHASFFKSLVAVEQVIVLGHSLSDVDAAYFQALLAQPGVAQAQWTIAVRDLNEWPDKQSLLAALDLPLNNAKPVLWQDL